MLKVYTVFDSKVGAYMNPIFLRSKGEAIRVFQASVNSPDTDFSKWPEDYTLFELGSYDPDSASFELHPTPLSCGVAVEFVNRDQPVAMKAV